MDLGTLRDAVMDMEREADTTRLGVAGCLQDLEDAVTERVLSSLSRKGYNTIGDAATAAPELSPDLLPSITNADKAVHRTLSGLAFDYSNAELLYDTTDAQECILNYFTRAPETIHNRPPARPVYADYLVSQTLAAGQPLVQDAHGLLSFLLQDSVDHYLRLQGVERALTFKGLVLNRFPPPSDLRRIQFIALEIARHKQATVNLLLRVLSVCVHAQLSLPAHLLSRAIAILLTTDVAYERKDVIQKRLKEELLIREFDSETFNQEFATFTKRTAPEGGEGSTVCTTAPLAPALAAVDHWITTEDLKIAIRRHALHRSPIHEFLPHYEWQGLTNSELLMLDSVIEAREFHDVPIDLAARIRKFIGTSTNGIISRADATGNSVPGARSSLSNEQTHFHVYVSTRSLCLENNIRLRAVKQAMNDRFRKPIGGSAKRPEKYTELAQPVYPLSLTDCIGCFLGLGSLKDLGFAHRVNWETFIDEYEERTPSVPSNASGVVLSVSHDVESIEDSVPVQRLDPSDALIFYPTRDVLAGRLPANIDLSSKDDNDVRDIDIELDPAGVINIDALMAKIEQSMQSMGELRGVNSELAILSGQFLFCAREQFSSLFRTLPCFASRGIRPDDKVRSNILNEEGDANVNSIVLPSDAMNSAQVDDIFVVDSFTKMRRNISCFERLYHTERSEELGHYYNDPGLDSVTPFGIYTGDCTSTSSNDYLRTPRQGVLAKLHLESTSETNPDAMREDIVRLSPGVHNLKTFVANSLGGSLTKDQLATFHKESLYKKPKLSSKSYHSVWKDAIRSYYVGSSVGEAFLPNHLTTDGRLIPVKLDGFCSIVLGLISGASIRERESVSNRIIKDEIASMFRAYSQTETRPTPYRHLHKVLCTSLMYFRFVLVSRIWAELVQEMTKIHALLSNSEVIARFLAGDFSLLADFYFSNDEKKEGTVLPPENDRSLDLDQEILQFCNVTPFSYGTKPFYQDPIMGSGTKRDTALPTRPIILPGVSESAARIASHSDFMYTDLIPSGEVLTHVEVLNKIWISLLRLRTLPDLSDDLPISATGTDANDSPDLPDPMPHPITDATFHHSLCNVLFIVENDGVYSLSRKKLVFSSAIADISAILYDDHVTISEYLRRVITRIRTSALRLMIRRKYMNSVSPPKQGDLSAIPNKDLYSLLDQADRKFIDGLTIDGTLDRMGILLEVLQQELDLLRQKAKVISCLYESLLHTYDAQKAREIAQTMFSIAYHRPKVFVEYVNCTPFTDELGEDSTGMADMRSQGIDSLPLLQAASLCAREIPHPAYPIRSEVRVLRYMSETLSSIIDLELEHYRANVVTQVDAQKVTQRQSVRGVKKISQELGFYVYALGDIPQPVEELRLSRAVVDGRNVAEVTGSTVKGIIRSPCNAYRYHILGEYVPSLSNLYRIPLALNQTASELLGQLLSEALPKPFTIMRTTLSMDEDGSITRPYTFPIFSMRLSLTSRLAAARVMARSTVNLIRLWRTSGSTLPSNIASICDPGLFSSPKMIEQLIEKSIHSQKTEADGMMFNTVTADRNIVAERLICSLVGLMVPPGGGFIGKATLTAQEKAHMKAESGPSSNRTTRRSSARPRTGETSAPPRAKPILRTGTPLQRQSSAHLVASGSINLSESYDTEGERNVVELDDLDFGPLASLFARSVTMKDVFLQLDKGARIQVISLLAKTTLRTWEGFPNVLPISFQLLAMGLNALWAKRLLYNSVVLSHVLRLAEMNQHSLLPGIEINKNLISLFPRTILDPTTYTALPQVMLASSTNTPGIKQDYSVSLTAGLMAQPLGREDSVPFLSSEKGITPGSKTRISLAALGLEYLQENDEMELPLDGFSYQEYVGHQTLTNNLPFLASVDAEALHYLLALDPNNPAHVCQLFLSEDFNLNPGISLKASTTLGDTLFDVLHGGNVDGVSQSPLVSPLLRGILGILGRTAYTEVCVNSLRSATIRANQLVSGYITMNNIVQGHYDPFNRRRELFNMMLDESVTGWKNCVYKCARVGHFYRNLRLRGRTDITYYTLGDRARRPGFPSSYLLSSEDTLFRVANLAHNEYAFRLRQFQNDEANPAILYSYRQALFYTCCQALLSESKRHALEAQIKGQLNLVRSYLQETNIDKLRLMVHPPPLYRNVISKDIDTLSTEALLTTEGYLGKILTVPHPVSFMMDSQQIGQLEIVLQYFLGLEAVVRLAYIKSFLGGADLWAAYDNINSELAFISELLRVHIQVGQTHGIQTLDDNSLSDLITVSAPSCIYLEDGELEEMRRCVKSILSEYCEVMSMSRSGLQGDAQRVRFNDGDGNMIQAESKTRVAELEITDLRSNLNGVLASLRDVAHQNLEYCKVDVLVKKILALHDRANMLLFGTLVQIVNSTLHKGLGAVARSFMETLEILAVRQNYQVGLMGASLNLSPTGLYNHLVFETLSTRFQQNRKASPYLPAPADVFNASGPNSKTNTTDPTMEQVQHAKPLVSKTNPFKFADAHALSAIEPIHMSVQMHCDQIRGGTMEEIDPEFVKKELGSLNTTLSFQVGSVFSLDDAASYTNSGHCNFIGLMSLPIMDPYGAVYSRYALTNSVARIQLHKLGLSETGAPCTLPLFGDTLLSTSKRSVTGAKRPFSCSYRSIPVVDSPVAIFSSFSYGNMATSPYSSVLHLRSLAQGTGVCGSLGFFMPFGLCSDFTAFQLNRQELENDACATVMVKRANTAGNFVGPPDPFERTGMGNYSPKWHALLYPKMLAEQDALLLGGFTSIELTSLCVCNTMRTGMSKLKAGESITKLLIQDECTVPPKTKPIGLYRTIPYDSSSWAGHLIETTILSRIIEQDRLERIYLRLHGIDECNKNSVLLSPMAVFGPKRAEMLFGEPFMRALNEVRMLEDELVRKRSTFERTKGPSMVTMKQHDIHMFMLLPMFTYLDDMTASSITVSNDSSILQELVPIFRSLQTEALYQNIRAIATRQLWRRLGFLYNHQTSLNRYNLLISNVSDGHLSGHAYGQSYFSFLSSIGTGVRLCRTANCINREQTTTRSPFSMTLMKQVQPTIINTIGHVTGLTDMRLNDGEALTNAAEQVSISGKTRAARGLIDVLRETVSEAGARITEGNRLAFSEATLMQYSITSVISGLASYLVGRLVSRLKRDLMAIQIRNPVAYLYMLTSVYTAIVTNAPEYTVSMSSLPTVVPNSPQPGKSKLPQPSSGEAVDKFLERFSLDMIMFNVETLNEKLVSITQEVVASCSFIEAFMLSLLNGRCRELAMSIYEANTRGIESMARRREVLMTEAIRRALSSLGPMARDHVLELLETTMECYSNVYTLSSTEEHLRNVLHAEMSRRIVYMYTSIIVAKRHKFILLRNKQEIIRGAVTSTQKKYEQILGVVNRLGAKGLDDDQALEPYNCDVMASYDANIRELVEDWGNMRLSLLLARSFNNFRASCLRTKLENLTDSISAELGQFNREIWIVLARYNEIELNLGRKVNMLHARIATKTAYVAELHARIDKMTFDKRAKPGVTSDTTLKKGPGSNANYGRLMTKLLPKLTDAVATPKICNEAETQLVQLRKLMAERTALQQEADQIQQSIDQLGRQARNNEATTAKQIQHEQTTIAKAEEQCNEVPERLMTMQTSMQLLKANLAPIEEAASRAEKEQLNGEIDAALEEITEWRAKIAQLRSEYPEIFSESFINE
ncbi:hypothetical protein GMRT_10947 [Giardia muris]|uniref:Uncharacterized protein n=1 Tax=Giardia muris TaxID=5742 RepID=A0A4Z1SXB9_GIAMU|nr:hypothetical protein GMRT_10947 [Giardia muris]|eukprot:TNJ30432.1 hypothetical protein GMRT_10947 [Giardia muris]